MASTPDGHGYWLVGANGKVFAFGDAASYSPAGDQSDTHQAVVGMASTPDGHGYWLVGANGKVFAFGDAPFYGSATHLGAKALAIVANRNGHGYWVVSARGRASGFGASATLRVASGSLVMACAAAS
jgi:hypothetical protein